MVNPNPNSARNSDWTRSFAPTNTWRRGQWTLWTMTACALVLPVFIANKTQAEPKVSLVALPASPAIPARGARLQFAPATPFSAPAPVKAPVKSPVAAAPVTVPFTAIVAGVTKRAQIAATPQMTVGQALAAMGVALSPLDRIVPDASAAFKPNMTARVTRVTAQLVTRRESIAAQVRYQPSITLKPGAKQTIQYPRAGYNEITERVWCKDGKVSSRQFVAKKSGQAPQHQIIALGAKASFLPSQTAPHRRYASALSYRGGSPRDRAAQNGGKPPVLRVVRSLKMMTTGYNGAEMGGGGSRTATGLRCSYGAIAVDPRVIPLGSQLYVEGYGYGFACDTGGAIKGNHIDLAFNSVREANNHGKKRGVTVYILGE